MRFTTLNLLLLFLTLSVLLATFLPPINKYKDTSKPIQQYELAGKVKWLSPYPRG